MTTISLFAPLSQLAQAAYANTPDKSDDAVRGALLSLAQPNTFALEQVRQLIGSSGFSVFDFSPNEVGKNGDGARFLGSASRVATKGRAGEREKRTDGAQ